MGRAHDSAGRLRLRDYRVRWWGWLPVVVFSIAKPLGNSHTDWSDWLLATALMTCVAWLPLSFLAFVFFRSIRVATISLGLFPTIFFVVLFTYLGTSGPTWEESVEQRLAPMRAASAVRAEHEDKLRKLTAAAAGTSYLSAEREAVLRHLIEAGERGYTTPSARNVFTLASFRSDVEIAEDSRRFNKTLNTHIQQGGLLLVEGQTQSALFARSDSLLHGAEVAVELAESFDRAHQVYAEAMRDPLVSEVALAGIERHFVYTEGSRRALQRLAAAFELGANIHRQLASWWEHWEWCTDCGTIHFEELITEVEIEQYNDSVVHYQAEFSVAWDELTEHGSEWLDWVDVNSPLAKEIEQHQSPDEP